MRYNIIVIVVFHLVSHFLNKKINKKIKKIFKNYFSIFYNFEDVNTKHENCQHENRGKLCELITARIAVMSFWSKREVLIKIAGKCSTLEYIFWHTVWRWNTSVCPVYVPQDKQYHKCTTLKCAPSLDLPESCAALFTVHGVIPNGKSGKPVWKRLSKIAVVKFCWQHSIRTSGVKSGIRIL